MVYVAYYGAFLGVGIILFNFLVYFYRCVNDLYCIVWGLPGSWRCYFNFLVYNICVVIFYMIIYPVSSFIMVSAIMVELFSVLCCYLIRECPVFLLSFPWCGSVCCVNGYIKNTIYSNTQQDAYNKDIK
jgi:hypothetical protein